MSAGVWMTELRTPALHSHGVADPPLTDKRKHIRASTKPLPT